MTYDFLCEVSEVKDVIYVMNMRGEEGLPSSVDLGFLRTAHHSPFSGSLVLLSRAGVSILSSCLLMCANSSLPFEDHEGSEGCPLRGHMLAGSWFSRSYFPHL